MTFEVETSTLESTIRSMETELADIVEISNRLYAALEALDGMWEGKAHDTFALQYRSDQNRLKNICKKLDNAIVDLSKARQKYDSCEQSVKNKISGITI